MFAMHFLPLWLLSTAVCRALDISVDVVVDELGLRHRPERFTFNTSTKHWGVISEEINAGLDSFYIGRNYSSHMQTSVRTKVNDILIRRFKESEDDEYGYRAYLAHLIDMSRETALRAGWIHSSGTGAAAFPESTSRPVHSFDIFDTILARDVEMPSDIFRIVQREFPFPYFYSYRRQAEHSAWASNRAPSLEVIYEQFRELTGVDNDTISKLKDFEIQTEVRHCYLITKNYYRVRDGDILVSDMYLPPEVILRMLRHAGFDRQVDIFVTPGGKFQDGWIYDSLKRIYSNIVSHFGDNYGSDVIQAQNHGLAAEYTGLHASNTFETALSEEGSKELSQLFRRFRLEYDSNPEGSRGSRLFLEQIEQNLPVLLLSAVKTSERMRAENLTRLLLITRDSCLVEKVMAVIFSEIDTRRFEASRFMITHPTPAYTEYVREMYIPQRTLLYDLQASRTVFNLITDLFNELPPLQLIARIPANEGDFMRATSILSQFTLHSSPSRAKFSYYTLECRNPDVVGSLSQTYAFASEEEMARILPEVPTDSHKRFFLRTPVGYYDIADAQFTHKVVDVFLQFVRDSIGVERFRSLLQSWRGEEACLDILLRAKTCTVGEGGHDEQMLMHHHISYLDVQEEGAPVETSHSAEWLPFGPSLEVALRPYFDRDIDVLVLSESDSESAAVDSHPQNGSCAACRFLQTYMGRQACFFAVSLPRLRDMSIQEQYAALSSLSIGGDQPAFCSRGVGWAHSSEIFDVIIREDLYVAGSGMGGDCLESTDGQGASLRSLLKPRGQVLSRALLREEGAACGQEEGATCFRCEQGECSLCESSCSDKCICAFRV